MNPRRARSILKTKDSNYHSVRICLPRARHRARVAFSAVFVPRRLDKYLRDTTALSVVEIRKACVEGRVSLEGAPAHSPETIVFEEDVVTLDGLVVPPRRQHQYLILNKPRFVTATVRDPDGRTDLGPWLACMPNGVFPVGRLDRETSGALLFCDDGDFANAILQPDHHTEKLYWLWIDERLSEDDPRLLDFVKGVHCAGDPEPLRARSAIIYHGAEDYTELHVTLDLGKNRQIRKMCNLLRLRLLELHRKSIGTLDVNGLAPGQWRQLTVGEVEQLWSCCGGTDRVTRTKIEALATMARTARMNASPHRRLEAWLAKLPPHQARDSVA